MLITEDNISFAVEFDADEIIRPIILGMRRIPWYRRVTNFPPNLVITFAICVGIFYLLNQVSLVTLFLSAVFAVVETAFISIYVFEKLSRIGVFLENKYKSELRHVPRPSTDYVLDDSGITINSGGSQRSTKWAEIDEAR